MNGTTLIDLITDTDERPARPSHSARPTASPYQNLAEVPGYARLQHEIHNALRAQHPEWIQPGGDCPTCDSYESRLAQLLRLTENTAPDETLEIL
jgi:hypothetical protein